MAGEGSAVVGFDQERGSVTSDGATTNPAWAALVHGGLVWGHSGYTIP